MNAPHDQTSHPNVDAPLTATSPAQRRAWGLGELAAPEEVAAGLWSVAIKMPGQLRMPYSLGYAFLEDDGVHIVDPGWESDETIDAWSAFLAARGRSIVDIATVVVTHGHLDHLGAATRLRAESGARVVLSDVEARLLGADGEWRLGDDDLGEALDRWGVPEGEREALMGAATRNDDAPGPVDPDLTLAQGDELSLGARTLVAEITPGHTSGHLCLAAPDLGVIFTGDHVLPQINPGLGLGTLPGSDPLADYVASLNDMRAYAEYEALPGHEYRFRGLATRSRAIAAHHLQRTRAVAELAPELGNAAVWEYASRSPWSRGWEGMQGFYRLSALMQTEQHVNAVRGGRAEAWLRGELPTRASRAA